MSQLTDPGAFYEELANIASWRSRCVTCSCPKWAHASKSIAIATLIAVGACDCGRCLIYVPRRAGIRSQSYRSEAHATIKKLSMADSKRITCQKPDCNDSASYCLSVEWDTGNTKGVSFSYYCAEHRSSCRSKMQ